MRKENEKRNKIWVLFFCTNFDCMSALYQNAKEDAQKCHHAGDKNVIFF
jgi:hypothetical protein